ENFKNPNFLHLFLARSILSGSIVFTTNFDYLIEHALLKIASPEEKERILPVITTREFERYGADNFSKFSDRLRFFKLHGAKRNIISNIKTTESLMTTLSAFGKGTNVLALDPAKKRTIDEALKGTDKDTDNTLVIMGYSGSDDFDIAPMLRQLFALKRLVWIEHSQEGSTEIIEFDPKKCFMIPEGLSRSEQLLAQISSNTEAQVIMVKTDTQKWIQDVIWNKLYGEMDRNAEKLKSEHLHISESTMKPQPLDEFLAQKFTKIPIELKWKTTADLYYELGYHSDFLRVAKKGLEVAKEANSEKLQSEFFNLLGIYFYSQKEYGKALEYYEDAIKLAEQSGYRYLKGSRLNNIGLIYYEQKNYEKAISYFKEALEIGLERGNNIGIAARLSNIGLVYLARGEFDKAKENFDKAYKIDEKIGNLIGRSIRLKNIGDLYKAQQDINESQNYYQKSYRILQKLGDLRRTGQILMEMAKTNLELKDFGKGLMNIKMAIKYLKGAEDPVLLKEAESILSEIKGNLH
ncbi:MAG: tetratricopeptide repeat protein, partial [Promethearchaeota archaeon]